MATQTTQDDGTRDFHEQLKTILPRLRIYALSLTRDRDSADDLVHDTVIKALTGRNSFQPGTNLAAWLFRIQRNEFISGLRRRRPTVPVDTAIAESLSHPPHQDSGLVMREFMSAFAKLAAAQREALLLAVLEGLPSRPLRNIPVFPSARSRAAYLARATRSSASCWRAKRATRPRPLAGPSTTVTTRPVSLPAKVFFEVRHLNATKP
jgi:RNA polymerase sigma factor (sigma-70 family)